MQVGRGNLTKLYKDLLCHGDVPFDFVEPLFAVVVKLRPDIETRTQEIVEIVNELRDPTLGKSDEDVPPKESDTSRSTVAQRGKEAKELETRRKRVGSALCDFFGCTFSFSRTYLFCFRTIQSN